MLFDLTVTILTAIKVLRLRSADTGIGSVLTRLTYKDHELCEATDLPVRMSSVGSALLNTIIQQSFQYFIFITAAVRFDDSSPQHCIVDLGLQLTLDYIQNLTNILYYAIDVSAPSSSLNGPLGG